MSAILTPVADALAPARTTPTSREWRSLCLAFTAIVALAPVLGFERMLEVLALVGIGGAVVGLGRPTLGAMSMAVLMVADAPIRNYVLTGGILRWNTLNYLLLVAALLRLPRILRRSDAHSWWLLLLAALAGAELLLSPDLENGVMSVLPMVACFGLLVYLDPLADAPEGWRWIARTAGLVSVIGCATYFVQQDALRPINANALAFFPLAGLFAICVAAATGDDAAPLPPDLLALAVGDLAAVFLTGSRSGLLVGLCCAAYLVRRTARGATVALVLAAAAVVLGAAATLAPEMVRASSHRWEVLVDDERTTTNKTSGRSDLLLGAVHIFREHPLGVGTGGFSTRWKDIDPTRVEGLSGFGRGRAKAAHAAWGKVLAENGAPGAILLAGWVGSFAFATRRCRRRGIRGLGTLTTVALAVAFLATEFQAKALWLLAGASTVVLSADRRRTRDGEDAA